MKPIVNSAVDHAVVEAAVHAKRQQQQKAAKVPAKPSSPASKVVAAGIWAAAAGSMVALMIGN